MLHVSVLISSSYLQVSKRDQKGQGSGTGKGRGKKGIRRKLGKEGSYTAVEGGNGGNRRELSSMVNGALGTGR